MRKLRVLASEVLAERDSERRDLPYYLLQPDPKTGHKMSDRNVEIELSQFIASGHETTGGSVRCG